MDCGGKTSENITHFTKSVGEAAALTGECHADVCRLNNNICQLRLDFTSFVLAGPSTNTQTTHFTSFGEPVSSGTPNRIAQTSIGKLVSLILFKLSIDFAYIPMKGTLSRNKVLKVNESQKQIMASWIFQKNECWGIFQYIKMPQRSFFWRV